MTTVNSCPICSETDLKELYRCKDYTVSNETFSVKVCASCLLGITTPRPDSEQIDKYYLSDEYISHTGNTAGLMGKLYRTARNITLGWKQKLVTSRTTHKSILDFGCGTGEFLQTMQKHNWDVAGVEPSAIAKAKAEKLLNINIHERISDLEHRKFSAITLWHVLEHVPDLRLTLQQLHQSLTENGIIFIAVPNYQSADSGWYQHNWAGFDVPRHLWHFSQSSMRQLLHQNEFRLMEIKPMILDSFYISLLSEKYKGSPLIKQYLKGFMNGLKSNLKARKTSNYSSLVYIAQRK